MKIDDLKTKSEDELKVELDSLKKEAFNLRFQQATGQLENTARVRQVRRSVARVKTILSGKSTQEQT
ncbi:MAG: 50S ribosomal protein L29 [Rhodobacteraceae bacterium]|jgi:large subunit ribosomal protein L29|nr:MAG: 50S ribosomal protein L29 [Paracoccaceae bacterium]PQM66210.1 MAG: 50S ribosomal protein L29 [Paracoccaceae bacterium]|tara:strand:- start:38 stop:238 length:201 start_codon:yes stop_codon:yes gene_type:complete